MQQGMRKQLEDSQRAVPMGRTQAPPVDTAMSAPMPMEQPVPLSAPSQFPEEPITAGTESPLINSGTNVLAEDMKRLREYLPILQIAAQSEDSPQVLRDFVGFLRSV